MFQDDDVDKKGNKQRKNAHHHHAKEYAILARHRLLFYFAVCRATSSLDYGGVTWSASQWRVTVLFISDRHAIILYQEF